MVVDLAPVQALLDEARRLTIDAHGFEFDNSGVHKDSDKARVRRDLLAMRHYLHRAALEVEAVELSARGYADPLGRAAAVSPESE